MTDPRNGYNKYQIMRAGGEVDDAYSCIRSYVRWGPLGLRQNCTRLVVATEETGVTWTEQQVN